MEMIKNIFPSKIEIVQRYTSIAIKFFESNNNGDAVTNTGFTIGY